MAARSILVVDDDDNVRDLVVRYLKAQGYHTTAVTRGEEALPHLERPDLDLVITDFKMPGLNGLELAQKALAADPARPVILMTAFADVDNARKSVSIGIYDFIIKPFDLADFRKAVARALDHRGLVLQNQEYQRNLERMVEERTAELREALDRLHRKVKELEGRDRINQHLLTVHTLDETLSAVIEAVQTTLDVERVVVFLPDASGQKLRPAAGAGAGARDDFASSDILMGIADAWLREAGAVAEQAFREGRAPQAQGAGGVAVPMQRLGEVVGVIYAHNPFSHRPLTDEDAQTLASLTAQAAVAVSDARLYGDSEHWRAALENLGNV
jgi:FixJ family two-component response regulator